jgi:adenosylhomocysteine nucleosidase
MKSTKVLPLLLLTGLLLCAGPRTTLAETTSPLTAIMGAFGEEVSKLEEALSGTNVQMIMGIRFVTGTLEKRNVVLVSSGVGKVNAAVTAALLIDHFKPCEILFTGIAGAINPELRPGDIVIADKTVQHDLGTLTPEGIQLRGMRNPVDWERNPVFFDADSRLAAVAESVARTVEFEKLQVGAEERNPRIIRGIVASGDVFVASPAKKQELRKTVNADAVEMEGAAVAQVCRQFGVPCLVIRSITDSAESNARQEAGSFLLVATHNSTRLVSAIVGRLAESSAR